MTLRRAFAAVLCLLLLSLQVQSVVHPITHLAGKPADTGVTAGKVEAPCAECALLSAGSAAVFAHAPAWHGDAAARVAVFHAYRSRAADTPAWFRSRAPPLLV